MENFGLSERRACKLCQLNRSTFRYEKKPKDDEYLRERIRFLAERHRRYGSPRIYALLRREGLKVNHKRVERIYHEESLSLRRKRRKKLRSESREKADAPTRINEKWSMDFVSDSIAGGRRFRVLNVIDEFTREALCQEADTSLPARKVIAFLDRIADLRGYPDRLGTDNGPEFISLLLDQWCYKNGVKLELINPGKPVENCYVESFNGKFRDECLDMNWFTSIEQAKRIIEKWRLEYNEYRPHSSLNNLSPVEFRDKIMKGKKPEPLSPGG